MLHLILAQFHILIQMILEQLKRPHISIPAYLSIDNIIDKMKGDSTTSNVFTLSPVNVDTVCKLLCELKTKRATGMIPPKLLKIGSVVLCYPINKLLNYSQMFIYIAHIKQICWTG